MTWFANHCAPELTWRWPKDRQLIREAAHGNVITIAAVCSALPRRERPPHKCSRRNARASVQRNNLSPRIEYFESPGAFRGRSCPHQISTGHHKISAAAALSAQIYGRSYRWAFHVSCPRQPRDRFARLTEISARTDLPLGRFTSGGEPAAPGPHCRKIRRDGMRESVINERGGGGVNGGNLVRGLC